MVTGCTILCFLVVKKLKIQLKLSLSTATLRLFVRSHFNVRVLHALIKNDIMLLHGIISQQKRKLFSLFNIELLGDDCKARYTDDLIKKSRNQILLPALCLKNKPKKTQII